jgi:UDPglucose--hexose-1-phosphate uridylyltransferase
MHKLTLKKPDGRSLILYSANPIDHIDAAPTPSGSSIIPSPHLRWHPLRGEWISYAAYRQDRTFLPEFNPLAPMTDPDHPTELPSGNYDIAVFQNRFPSLSMNAENPPKLFVDSLPATGVCEVVVYTQQSDTSLTQLPLSHLELLIEVWIDRYCELGKMESIQYVMPFENRGVEVGVTLHHPHGQIYAYPFVPPVALRELEQQKKYWNENHRSLLEDLIQSELKNGSRILYQGEVAAFVPVCARYAYEVWISPIHKRSSLAELTAGERKDFARALKTVLMKYDAIWNRPFPYVMVFHQAPTDNQEHPESHFHVEFYPPYRSETRLKYLAGTELGAGMFTSDTLPEDTAAELKKIEVSIEP